MIRKLYHIYWFIRSGRITYLIKRGRSSKCNKTKFRVKYWGLAASFNRIKLDGPWNFNTTIGCTFRKTQFFNGRGQGVAVITSQMYSQIIVASKMVNLIRCLHKSWTQLVIRFNFLSIPCTDLCKYFSMRCLFIIQKSL